MRQILSDLWLFVSTIVTYWQALAGGLIAMAIGLFERLTKWRLSFRWYVGLFFVGFLLSAFFMAWRDQFYATREANEAVASLTKQLETARDQSQPKLDGHLYSAWLSENDEKSVDVILLLTVRNQGAPTIVRGWRLIVTPPGASDEIVGIPMHYVGAKMVFYEPDCNCDYIFEPNAALYMRVAEDPIPTGAERSGYLTFKFPSLKKDAIDKEGTKFLLSFYDVRENRHVADLTYHGPHVPGTIPTIPGLTYKPHDEGRFRKSP